MLNPIIKALISKQRCRVLLGVLIEELEYRENFEEVKTFQVILNSSKKIIIYYDSLYFLLL